MMKGPSVNFGGSHTQEYNPQAPAAATLFGGGTTTSFPGTPGPAPAPSFHAPSPGGIFGSTGGFGSPAPAPGLGSFGTTNTTTTPTPAFGSAPAPGGLFGPATAPSPGGFSVSSPAPSPGGLFGSNQAPAGGASLFGAPSTGNSFGPSPAPFSAGLFGSAPAPTGSGFFGSNSTSQQQSTGPKIPHQKAMEMMLHAQDQKFCEEAKIRVEQVTRAYSLNMPAPTDNQDAPFVATFYNPASSDYLQKAWIASGGGQSAHARPLIDGRPQQISTKQWQRTCASAPVDYEPVVALGPQALLNRLSLQQQQAASLLEQVGYLQKMIKALEERKEAALRQGYDVKKRQLRQDRRNRLWDIMKKFELIRAYQQPLNPDERKAFEYARQLAVAASKEEKDVPTFSSAIPKGFPRLVMPDGESPVDPASVRQFQGTQHAELAQMLLAVKKDLRDVKLLLERFQAN